MSSTALSGTPGVAVGIEKPWPTRHANPDTGLNRNTQEPSKAITDWQRLPEKLGMLQPGLVCRVDCASCSVFTVSMMSISPLFGHPGP